jgi:hypothetical protein
MLKDFTITFMNYYFNDEVYVVKGAPNLQVAVEMLGATIQNSPAYFPIEQLDDEEITELEELGWVYIDSTEYGGGCGYFDFTAINIREEESEVE